MTNLDSSTPDCGCVGTSHQTGSTTGDAVCSDLPDTPFVELRPVTGMLLGEDDFRVLVGNPRGKQMLHNGWLHGFGVVWGLGLELHDRELRVLPGLALDGTGRELLLTSSWCVDLDSWARTWAEEHQLKSSCEEQEVEVWVVAEFGCCLSRPMPALSDPCDVTRKHDDFSRVLETTRIRIVDERPPRLRGFHRVRVLLGLDDVGDDDPAGNEGTAAAAEVAQAASDERAETLLHWFRRLAAADEMDLGPERREGDADLPFGPLLDEDSAVLLARLDVRVGDENGCLTVREVTIDPALRATLLPTRTIQELVCGLAPGLIGVDSDADAGGPRLIRDSVEWTSDLTRVSFRVTRSLEPGSGEGSVEVSSLDPRRGWATDEVQRVQISSGGTTVHVYLDAAPTYDVVRLVIHGTGPRVLFGVDPPVPFAGVVGGPPGTADDGNDAVVTERPGNRRVRSRRGRS